MKTINKFKELNNRVHQLQQEIQYNYNNLDDKYLNLNLITDYFDQFQYFILLYFIILYFIILY
jgi:hypothetical protein